jgi:hypothetical protein
MLQGIITDKNIWKITEPRNKSSFMNAKPQASISSTFILHYSNKALVKNQMSYQCHTSATLPLGKEPFEHYG